MGERIWSHDRAAQRISIFSAAGESVAGIIRSRVRPTPADASFIPLLYVSAVHAVLEDRSLIVEAQPAAGDTAKRVRGMEVVTVDSAGLIRAHLATVPERGAMFGYATPDRASYCFSVVPFPNEPRTTASPSGDRVVTAVAHIPSSEGGVIKVSSIGVRGDTAWTRELPFRGRPIPRDMAVAAIEDQARELTTTVCGSDYPVAYRAGALALTPPARPPLQNLLVGLDGSVWVEAMFDVGPTWTILNRNGEVRGTLFIPGATLLGADRDRIWVAELRGERRTITRLKLEANRP
jgi:hypothetical protein